MPRPAPVTTAFLPSKDAVTLLWWHERAPVLPPIGQKLRSPSRLQEETEATVRRVCHLGTMAVMATEDGAASGTGIPGTRTLDPDSVLWLRSLGGTEEERTAALVRLHDLLLRIAHSEVRRRSGHLRMAGPELDDVAHQAAADALVAITAKIEQFRGESRFTTWAFKFVIFEVSTKIGRHFWRKATVPMEAEDWDRLPDRFGLDPAAESEWRELVAALHKAVDEVLTDWQRQIFVAIVLNGLPLDALVAELGSNRNAIYKTMFDARRKLRAELAAKGYLDTETSRTP
jgi:RNA polymerase sigma-70 factor, ECF subfamily